MEEFDKAAVIASEKELNDILTPPENRDYFTKLYDFMHTKKPFYDEEMQQLIADGVVDGCGDKPLAELIKKLAGRMPDPSYLSHESKEKLQKTVSDSFREMFDL